MRKKAKTILKDLGYDRAELSILFTDDREIQSLNRDWLGKDRPTDVISWPQETNPPTNGFIGDLAISIDSALRQANERALPLERELERLLIHGILHLLGHDHLAGGPKARAMRREEDRLAELLIEVFP
jgi:probable rRNA maturation factor